MFFPDGTWCHNDGSEDYFCLKHRCLSESQSRQPRKNSYKPEVHILQNAKIEANDPDKTVVEYFTVDKNGNPISKTQPKIDEDSGKDGDKTDFPMVNTTIYFDTAKLRITIDRYSFSDFNKYGSLTMHTPIFEMGYFKTGHFQIYIFHVACIKLIFDTI